MELPTEIWQIIVDNAETVYTKIDESTEFDKIYDYVIDKSRKDFLATLIKYNKTFTDGDIVKYFRIDNNTKYFIWKDIFRDCPYIYLHEVFPSINGSFLGHYNLGNYQIYHEKNYEINVLKSKLLLHESRASIVDKINNYQFNVGNIILYKTGYRRNDIASETIFKVYKKTIKLNSNRLINKHKVFMIYNNNETPVHLAINYYNNNVSIDRWAYIKQR